MSTIKEIKNLLEREQRNRTRAKRNRRSTVRTRPKMKPHWYKITRHYCPACGREEEYRERIFGQRPKDPSKRIITRNVWNHCEL